MHGAMLPLMSTTKTMSATPLVFSRLCGPARARLLRQSPRSRRRPRELPRQRQTRRHRGRTRGPIAEQAACRAAYRVRCPDLEQLTRPVLKPSHPLEVTRSEKQWTGRQLTEMLDRCSS